MIPTTIVITDIAVLHCQIVIILCLRASQFQFDISVLIYKGTVFNVRHLDIADAVRLLYA